MLVQAVLQTTPSPANRGCCSPLRTLLAFRWYPKMHIWPDSVICHCVIWNRARNNDFESENYISSGWIYRQNLSYRFPLLSPLWHLQSATGNKGNSAHCVHPEAPLWHSDRTSYLPPSTSASQVSPWRWSQVETGWSPCTYPPVGGGETAEALSVQTQVNGWCVHTYRSSAKVQSRVVQQGALALPMFPQ